MYSSVASPADHTLRRVRIVGAIVRPFPTMTVAQAPPTGNHGDLMVDRTVGELLEAAAAGDKSAWDELVDRFGGLVWSVARSFRLDPASAADVSQTTWLRLVENLDRIRQPEALPGWLATTTKREALRLIGQRQRYVPTVAVESMLDPVFVDPAADLLESERARSLLKAFRSLSEACRELLRLLAAEPPLDYAEVARLLGKPIGSIGPTRGRCLEHMRRKLAAAGGTERVS